MSLWSARALLQRVSERCSGRPEKVNGQPGLFGRACLEEDRWQRHVHRQGAELWSAVSNVFLVSLPTELCGEHCVLRGMFEAVAQTDRKRLMVNPAGFDGHV